MKAAILLPVLARHDAVGNDALAMARILRERGIDTRVFCDVAVGVDEPTSRTDELLAFAGGPNDLVIYHFSVGAPAAIEILRRARGYRVVRYHNITPPEFFVGWSEGYVGACTAGRAELDAYAALNCELYLGCSPFNLEDFSTRGVDPARSAVVPPFHKVEELLAVAPDARRTGNNADGAPELLMVGRIAPNKGDLALVDALTVMRRTSDPRTRLIRIGKLDPNLERYGVAVREHVREMGAEAHVVAIDDATPGELRAAYAAADALVMLSAHEGFCVPLVEAMALGTPIVALGSSAIAWTVGDAGIVWSEPDPHLVAMSIVRLHTDLMLREMLRELGRARYRTVFAPAALAKGLETAFARFAA